MTWRQHEGCALRTIVMVHHKTRPERRALVLKKSNKYGPSLASWAFNARISSSVTTVIRVDTPRGEVIVK